VTIDDPRAGHVEGQAALEDYCRESGAWLSERQAHARSLAVTNGKARLVGEFEVDMVQDGRAFTLPVAVVVEPNAAKRSVAIRSYHSHWPILGRHVVRSPLLRSDPDAIEADVVGEYQAALRAGDAAAWGRHVRARRLFPGAGRRRSQLLCGTDSLRELAAAFFARGGIVLEHCTVTDDGTRVALEFNAVAWAAGRCRIKPASRSTNEAGAAG
jgi:hypothetical protein